MMVRVGQLRHGYGRQGPKKYLMCVREMYLPPTILTLKLRFAYHVLVERLVEKT